MFTEKFQTKSKIDSVIMSIIKIIANTCVEDVYVTIRNPSFRLVWYLTGEHFWGKLQHVGDVSVQKVICGPIRTREIGGVRLQEELYA